MAYHSNICLLRLRDFHPVGTGLHTSGINLLALLVVADSTVPPPLEAGDRCLIQDAAFPSIPIASHDGCVTDIQEILLSCVDFIFHGYTAVTLPLTTRSSPTRQVIQHNMEESKGGEGEGRGRISGGGEQRDTGNKRSADDAGLASRAEAEEDQGQAQFEAPLLHP